MKKKLFEVTVLTTSATAYTFMCWAKNVEQCKLYAKEKYKDLFFKESFVKEVIDLTTMIVETFEDGGQVIISMQ